ncbi:hypothetical protein OEZ85_006126 [Tetradesmus obliquus]|uniref:Uncharacterized protein n=1 Tax=Tetradesmus obliquus TaxID=3088 RepID=A0ABY8UFY2_TETOB|nr:hypothetical protein OEZ85_006126 [Tetradesmus obliquus]
MVCILHSTKDRDSVLEAGVILGSTRNSRKKGLTEAFPLIATTVTRVCSGEWYLCEPKKNYERWEGGHFVKTLYLIPSNEPAVAGAAVVFGTSAKEWYCQSIGMARLLERLLQRLQQARLP